MAFLFVKQFFINVWSCATISPVNGSPEGAGGNQHAAAAVHGQDHSSHPRSQPIHPGD